VEGENADRVAADPQIDRVAEADHAAIAHDQVEAHRGDGPDHDPGEDDHIERLAQRRRQEGHHGAQADHDGGQDVRGVLQVDHG
jgi:hypothetical protein